MLEYTREGLLELTKKLVSIRSISHTAGENEAAAFIYESLAVEPYFQKHPDFLRYLPVEEGGLERRAVMALVRAGSHTRRTVLLNGHFDVVDTDVCGDLAEAAFDAAEYTRLVAERDIILTILLTERPLFPRPMPMLGKKLPKLLRQKEYRHCMKNSGKWMPKQPKS